MAVLNQCCCGCSLKMGTIIIAVLCVIWSLIQIAIAANRVHIHQAHDEAFALLSIPMRFSQAFNTEDGSFSNTLGKVQPEALASVTMTQLSVSLVLAIIQAVGGLLLLFGAIKGIADIIFPWMVAETLVATAWTAIDVSIYATLMTQTTAGSGIAGIISDALFGVFGMYFLVVVYSYYQTLRGNPWGPTPLINTHTTESPLTCEVRRI